MSEKESKCEVCHEQATRKQVFWLNVGSSSEPSEAAVALLCSSPACAADFREWVRAEYPYGRVV